MAQKRILLIDPDPGRQQETVELLRPLAAEVLTAADGNQALGILENVEPDLILCDALVPGPSAKELGDYTHDFVAEGIPFVLVQNGPAPEADREQLTTFTELTLHRPLSAHLLEVACAMLLRESALKTQLKHLEEENSKLRQSLQDDAAEPKRTIYHLSQFKPILLTELKRARRYSYTVSLALLSLDRYQEISHWLSGEQRKGLLGLVRRVVVTGTRDIDIPLLYAEDKLMLVMPHTRLDGAAVMADRLRERICGIKPPGSLTQLSVTASLSVASTEADREASFGKMVQQAVRGLQEAELKGGNVVIICANAPQGGPDAAASGDAGGKLGPRIFFT